jgi:chorismate synthase
MAGSSFGRIFQITTWGESHGKALGAVVDGAPAGLLLCENDIQAYLDRRKPGQSTITTSRKEGDTVEILSGVFEGRTTGTPISLMVRNTSARSGDYSQIASVYRPGHADITFDGKYGFRDYRGGGRSSGRETVGRVAGGAIAAKLLQELGISVFAYTQSIGPVEIDSARFDASAARTTQTGMPDTTADRQALAYMEQIRAKGDSAGGCITCVAKGLPVGLGDPVFEKLDANLAKAIMSIGAVKAVEIGDGVQVANLTGSTCNDSPGEGSGWSSDYSGMNSEGDSYHCNKISGRGSDHSDKRSVEDSYHNDKFLGWSSNHSGGILGGISNGAPLVLRAYIKPTPSISMPQQTLNQAGEPVTIEIKGRHDPVIVPRAVVVVEAMTALVIADALLLNMGSRLDRVKEFYR